MLTLIYQLNFIHSKFVDIIIFAVVNKGILYIILSGLCFVVVNFFVKILGAGSEQSIIDGVQSYPPHELVLARSLVSFSISYFIIKRKGLPLFGVNKKWLLIRGLSGTFALTIFFYNIHFLPLAVASTIQYLSPIFTVIFAIFILKERVRTIQWMLIALSFLGVALIGSSKIFDVDIQNEISFFWLGMGVISAVFSGLAYTAIIKLKTTDEPISIVMYFPMVAIPIMSILCLFEFTFPNGIEWIILLVLGIFTQLAQILMTKALHGGATALIMPFKYLGAIYAFSIGYFLFDETLSLMIDIGIVVVLLGVIGNVLLRNR